MILSWQFRLAVSTGCVRCLAFATHHCKVCVLLQSERTQQSADGIRLYTRVTPKKQGIDAASYCIDLRS